MRCARKWLIETQRAGRLSEYRLHHDSIRAYIAVPSAPTRSQRITSRWRSGWRVGPAPAEAAALRYTLHHALLHRAEAGA